MTNNEKLSPELEKMARESVLTETQAELAFHFSPINGASYYETWANSPRISLGRRSLILLEAQALATAKPLYDKGFKDGEKATLKRVGEKLERDYLCSIEWRSNMFRLIDYLKQGKLE